MNDPPVVFRSNDDRGIKQSGVEGELVVAREKRRIGDQFEFRMKAHRRNRAEDASGEFHHFIGACKGRAARTESFSHLVEVGLHVGGKHCKDMLFDAVALHRAAKRLSALTKFGAADFGDGLARLAGRFMADDPELSAALFKETAELFKHVFDHDLRAGRGI